MHFGRWIANTLITSINQPWHLTHPMKMINRHQIIHHPSFITSPLLRPRSCIPAVTQSQSPENEVRNDDASDPNSDEDTYIHYHDPELVHQTPMRQPRTSSITNVPIVHSPDKSAIDGKEALAHSAAKYQKRRSKGRQSIQKMQKCQKMNVSLSAHNNILTFIRQSSFNSMVNELTASTIPMSKFDAIARSANSHWKGSQKVPLNFEPFETLESNLMHSLHQPITFQHHYLLLEEMMLLPEGSKFICSISSKRYLLKHGPTLSKIQKCLKIQPCQPCFIDRKV